MANYIVQPGETLSQIAKKMNVPISMISGYKSGDPNVILPGENLSVGQMDQLPQQLGQPQPNRGAAIAGLAQQITSAPGQPSPILPQQPQQPIAATQTPQQPGQPQLQQPGQPQLQQPGQVSLDAIQQQINALRPQIEALKPQAEAIEQPKVTDNKVLDQYGISPSNLEYGFQTNPQKTISELVQEVMSSIGLPDISSNISDISKQIEDLENERDDEIEKIQINPWTSAGSKQELIKKIDNRYEKKIGNRTNRLTLMQSAYNNARQEAQFAATTAISLYDKNRNYDIRLLEDAIKTAEREAAAKLKLGPLTTETINGFTVLRDAEGNIVSTMKPKEVTAEDKTSAYYQIRERATELFSDGMTPDEYKQIQKELTQYGLGEYLDNFEKWVGDMGYLTPESKKELGIVGKIEPTVQDVLNTLKKNFQQYKDANYSRKDVENQYMAENKLTDIPEPVEKILDEIYKTESKSWLPKRGFLRFWEKD